MNSYGKFSDNNYYEYLIFSTPEFVYLDWINTKMYGKKRKTWKTHDG